MNGIIRGECVSIVGGKFKKLKRRNKNERRLQINRSKWRRIHTKR